MKRPTAAQAQNIVFTVIVAIAAVAIYLLAGNDDRLRAADTLANASAAMETPEPALRFEPMPESIFISNVNASDVFSAGRRSGEENAFNLICGDQHTGAAVLSYALDDNRCISAIALRFACLPEPNEKSREPADAVYASLYETYVSRQNEAVEAMLRELLYLSDVNDAFAEPILLRWYTGAVAARDFKKYYTETYRRCEFMAYPSQWGGEQVVICSMMSLS